MHSVTLSYIASHEGTSTDIGIPPQTVPYSETSIVLKTENYEWYAKLRGNLGMAHAFVKVCSTTGMHADVEAAISD
ncbi:uncharacterized protein PHALS_09048 [Plasmopara halstedii]|uniref:Uncharacterized protein n=1 Tax=Plasmopara halstedii TaxID=4781 RepID=A0A0P1A491_PLAHL|nr:uncharacterized protein PHALS_09048 [Plasmopara halstedii]CEG35236.1 hypothetical protein PHALS_09048 [Plasmopara halstedii]|eukprot:XP_024571605.1 hypothetical protein PHALS_09048 [Plasmopara halstedii]